jgi:hypothetical protein
MPKVVSCSHRPSTTFSNLQLSSVTCSNLQRRAAKRQNEANHLRAAVGQAMCRVGSSITVPRRLPESCPERRRSHPLVQVLGVQRFAWNIESVARWAM